MTKHLVLSSALGIQDIQKLIHEALVLKGDHSPATFLGRSAAFVFLEPSSRTLMSFQAAAVKVGLGVAIFPPAEQSSLKKGESFFETLLNLDQMGFSSIITRVGDEPNLLEFASHMKTPLVNAGWGKMAHPTQALLDLMTLVERFGFDGLKGKTLGFIGDTAHSRVFASLASLLGRFGVRVLVLGEKPEERWSQGLEPLGDVLWIADFNEWVEGCDVVYSLRAQVERHRDGGHVLPRCLSPRDFESKGSETLLMAPGPVMIGTDMDWDLYSSPSSLILKQVENGVFLRASVLKSTINQHAGEL